MKNRTLCGVAVMGLLPFAVVAQATPAPEMVQCADEYRGAMNAEGYPFDRTEDAQNYPAGDFENVHIHVAMTKAEIEAKPWTGHQMATRLCAMRVAFENPTAETGHTIVFDSEGRIFEVSDRQNFKAMAEKYASYVLGRKG